MSWNDERVELLKKMWSEGQSASQIAKELGNVTRNAVIGKVHRLGLSNRAGAAPVKPAEKVGGEARAEARRGAGAGPRGAGREARPPPRRPRSRRCPRGPRSCRRASRFRRSLRPMK
jgi:GcrA cell cycle regulator